MAGPGWAGPGMAWLGTAWHGMAGMDEGVELTVVQIVVRCDECASAYIRAIAESFDAARIYAAKHGWTVTLLRDTCPRCARKPTLAALPDGAA